MRFANYIKVPTELPDEIKRRMVESYAEFHPGTFIKHKGRLVKLMKPLIVRSGQDGQDFIRNLLTFITEMDGFFVPRIIKRKYRRQGL